MRQGGFCPGFGDGGGCRHERVAAWLAGRYIKETTTTTTGTHALVAPGVRQPTSD